MIQFIHGALFLACGVCGLFFFHFWTLSRDRLFVYLAASFWILGLHWLVLGLSDPAQETRHYFYAARLLAFGLIVIGILDKNRRPPRN